MSERRFQYDAEVTRSPMNYDAWFDYVRLEENAGDPARVREVRHGSDQSLAMGGFTSLPGVSRNGQRKPCWAAASECGPNSVDSWQTLQC